MDVDALLPSPEFSADQLQKLKLAIPEVCLFVFFLHLSFSCVGYSA